jgi:protein O-mannosyl-transferase
VKNRDAERAWIVAILLATALVLSPSLGHQFVLDDRSQIVVNPHLANWSFIWKSLFRDAWWFFAPLHPPQSPYYRPLPNVLLGLSFHLFGTNPAGWHAEMIALHLIVVWLVFRVASLLARDQWTGLLAAALFGLMPIHADAISGSFAPGTPLSMAFELGAFEYYLRRSSLPDRRFRFLSYVLFAGALLTYEGAVAFPALIAAHAFIFTRPFPKTSEESATTMLTRSRVASAATWPYVLEVAAYFGLRLWVLGFISRSNPATHLTAMQAALTIPGAIATYTLLLVTPWRAAPAHQLEIANSIGAPAFYLPAAGLAAAIGAAIVLLRRHPHRALYLFCAVWFLITLAPMLNLGALVLKVFIQDRYLYLPSFGLCVIAADLAVSIARGGRVKARISWTGAAAVILGCAALLLFVQHFWRDDIAVYSRCIEAAPRVAFCHDRLGMTLAARGDLAGARQQLREAVMLAPEDGSSLYNLGAIDDRLGDHRTGMREIVAGLSRFTEPFPAGYAGLALAADSAGDASATEAALRRAEAMAGGVEIAAVTRAQLRLRHGDSKGAEAELRALLKQQPDNERALAALGTMLSSAHRYDDALGVYRRAIQVAAGDPDLHLQTASVLHLMGRDREARSECQLALAAMPDDPEARALMAAIGRSGVN